MKKKNNRYNWDLIGQRLKRLRQVMDLEFGQALNKLGIARTTYYFLEEGKTENMTVQTLGKICECYNTSECEILTGCCTIKKLAKKYHTVLNLSQSELDIIANVRRLSKTDQKRITGIVQAMVDGAPYKLKEKL